MAGYSFNETRYVKSNTYVEGSLILYNPKNTANASFNYAFSGKLNGLNLGMTVLYFGSRYAGRSTRVQVANDAYKPVALPIYAQINGNVSYTFKKVILRAKVGNIGNVLSYNVHDDNSVNPISPRNYTLGIAFKL